MLDGNSPSAGSRPVVLLAEDEPTTRRAMVAVLRRRGFEVLEAKDGDEALALIDDSEVIVADWGMPGTPVNEIAYLAAQRTPPRKMILTSGYAAETLRQRGEVLPDVPFLTKPFTADDLVKQIKAALS